MKIMMLKSYYYITGLIIIVIFIPMSFQEELEDQNVSFSAPKKSYVSTEKNSLPITSLKNIVDKANKGYTFAKDIGFFKISDKKTTWFQAFSECEKDGGFLTIPDTKGEIELVTDMLKSTGHTGIHDLYHIGLHKLNTNGRWFDVQNKLYSPGKDYNAKKSNLTSYHTTLAYNCGALWYNGQFYDVPCTNPAWYICEIPF